MKTGFWCSAESGRDFWGAEERPFPHVGGRLVPPPSPGPPSLRVPPATLLEGCLHCLVRVPLEQHLGFSEPTPRLSGA